MLTINGGVDEKREAELVITVLENLRHSTAVKVVFRWQYERDSFLIVEEKRWTRVSYCRWIWKTTFWNFGIYEITGWTSSDEIISSRNFYNVKSYQENCLALTPHFDRISRRVDVYKYWYRFWRLCATLPRLILPRVSTKCSLRYMTSF